MNADKIKEVMDACYTAKRVRDLLPDLPDGVAPSYIRFLDVISKLGQQKGAVRISDISECLDIPRPGVTRTVKEMEARGYVRKITSDEDARITWIEITDLGEELYDRYDRKYFAALSASMDEVSEQEADRMIATINKLYRIMQERRK